MSVASGIQLPSSPYRGIEPFRFADRLVFFEREREVRRLVDLIAIYRAVLFYGASGTGKSSLVNAGLIPALLADDFAPERIYVRPHTGSEFVVERIQVSDDPADGFLASKFAAEDDDSERIVLSIDAFSERLHPEPGEPTPLLIFDQFEEFITLFEIEPRGEALVEARRVQQRILDLLIEIIQDQTRPLKLLFSFREDYLAQFDTLFRRRPELRDHFLHLTPIPADQLFDIIRSPFEQFPGAFEQEISEELARKITAEIEQRSDYGDLNLSEAQIVLETLWKSPDPEALFEQRQVEGLLVDYLAAALSRFQGPSRDLAISLLSQLVTTAGTRNVVSEGDLVGRIRDERNVSEEDIKQTLSVLEIEARLIRKELRHNVYYYEVVSEFLIPWIAEQRIELESRAERQKQLEASREAFARVRRRFSYALALVLLAAAAIVLFVFYRQNARVEDQKTVVHAQSAAAQAQVQREEGNDEVSALLALQALRFSQEADGAALSDADRGLRSALEVSEAPFVVPLGTFEGASISSVDINSDRGLIATGDANGIVRVWGSEQPGEPMREFGGNGQPVRAIAFDAEGISLLAVTGDGAVLEGDPLGEEALLGEVGGVGQITLARFSARGDMLATFKRPGLSLGDSPDAEVLVWNMNDAGEQEMAPLVVPVGQEPIDFAVSDDGRWLATIQQQEGLRLWDVEAGEPVGLPMPAASGVAGSSDVPGGNEGEIAIVQFSGDSGTLVAGGAGGTIWIWFVGSSVGLPIRIDAERPLTSVTVSDRGEKIVAFSNSGTVVTWVIQKAGSRTDEGGTPEAMPDLLGPSSRTRIGAATVAIHPSKRLRSLAAPVAFDDDGTMLATIECPLDTARPGQCRYELSLWHIGDDRRNPSFAPNGVDVAIVSTGEEPGFVVATGADELQQWRLGTSIEQFREFNGQANDAFTLVAATPSGSLVAGSCATGMRNAAVSGSSELLLMTTQSLTAGCTSRITVWAGGSGEALLTIDGSECEGLRRLAIVESPSAPLLAAGCADGRILVWSLDSGDAVQTELELPGAITALVASGDGRYLAAGDSGGTVAAWSVGDDLTFEVLELSDANQGMGTVEPASGINVIAMSGDEDLLAAATARGDILVWTLDDPDVAPKRTIAPAEVYSLAFDQYGTTLTAGMNEVMAQWDVDEVGNEATPRTIREYGSAFLAVLYADETGTVVGIPTNGIIYTWATTESMAEQVCERVTRDLTEQEWNALIGADEPLRPICPDRTA